VPQQGGHVTVGRLILTGHKSSWVNIGEQSIVGPEPQLILFRTHGWVPDPHRMRPTQLNNAYELMPLVDCVISDWKQKLCPYHPTYGQCHTLLQLKLYTRNGLSI
jgi:hypothetical protein